MRSRKITATGWGRAHKAEEDAFRPERVSSATRLMENAPAPAMGNRRSYGDLAMNSGGASLDLGRLDRFLGFDPETGILDAEAGVTLGDILETFAPRGWIPHVLPGTGFATLGGAIANDVHGKNHHDAGTFGQFVTHITLATPGGKLTLTPARNARLFKATVGGLGQTGAILSARIKMKPVPGELMQVTETRIENIDEFLDAFDSSTASYSVGWIDATGGGAALGRGILEEAEPTAGQAPAPGRTRKVPLDAPGFLLSRPVVRLFNRYYFQRIPENGRTSERPMREFFFPLDRVHDWNRLYGKRGFHQFQCVLPKGQEEALRGILERVVASRAASPLAVLKKLGSGRAGMLSFPMEGVTLAVDFPNSSKVTDLIGELEDATLLAGGRIYFAKDALSTPAMAAQMYPELDAFAAVTNELDPDRHLRTDLVRRLDLRGS